MSDPIVQVELTVSENGAYYGWLRKNESIPTMIWPSKVQFEMCFPYGSKAEVESGEGRALRFNVEKVEEEQ